MSVYYNDNNPFVAQWLRNLIAAGQIAPGEVDERDIRDVRSNDVRGFAQCHFFAGIGGWPLALRIAGWPDNRLVWTGSCPCQPLSSAGKKRGDADERHLWPAFYSLIAQLSPAVVFGEQIAGAYGREWLSAVRFDLEGIAYAVGAADLGAASVGAPHARQRLWWVADAKWNKPSEPCGGPSGRMGRKIQSVPWDKPWRSALPELRALDDGVPRNVEATDAARNALVPQVAAEFIAAYMAA